MKNPFLAGGFLIIVLTIASLGGYALHQKGLRLSAESALVESSLALEGAKKALLVSPKEVIKFVEVPAAVTAAVKKGTMTPITAGKVEAMSEIVNIPCPPSQGDSILEDSGAPPPKTNTPPSVPISFGLTGEFYIGAIRNGSVQYTSTFKATAWSGTYHVEVPFKEENVRFDVVVSKDILKAVEAYQEPWIKKHFALACPGIGIAYQPLDTLRPVSFGITCSYSMVWF